MSSWIAARAGAARRIAHRHLFDALGERTELDRIGGETNLDLAQPGQRLLVAGKAALLGQIHRRHQPCPPASRPSAEPRGARQQDRHRRASGNRPTTGPARGWRAFRLKAATAVFALPEWVGTRTNHYSLVRVVHRTAEQNPASRESRLRIKALRVSDAAGSPAMRELPAGPRWFKFCKTYLPTP